MQRLISYERLVYESVQDNTILGYISKIDVNQIPGGKESSNS